MRAKVCSTAVTGIEAYPVEVEVDFASVKVQESLSRDPLRFVVQQ
jgi:hypothetical protein